MTEPVCADCGQKIAHEREIDQSRLHCDGVHAHFHEADCIAALKVRVATLEACNDVMQGKLTRNRERIAKLEQEIEEAETRWRYDAEQAIAADEARAALGEEKWEKKYE